MGAVGGEDGLKRQDTEGLEERELQLGMQMSLGLFEKDDLASGFLLKQSIIPPAPVSYGNCWTGQAPRRCAVGVLG